MATVDTYLVVLGDTGNLVKLEMPVATFVRKGIREQRKNKRERNSQKELQHFPHQKIEQLLGLLTNYFDIEVV